MPPRSSAHTWSPSSQCCPRWSGALLLGPQGRCPAGPHAPPHPGLWLCAVHLCVSPLLSLASPVRTPAPPWPPPLSHRPVLPPSGSRSSPSLAPGWPWASQRVLCLAPRPEGPRTHYESGWVGGGGHVEVLPLTPPQPVAHRPSLGETRRWMLLSSMTASGPPSGTSTGPRSGEGGEGMWSPPPPPPPHPWAPHKGTASSSGTGPPWPAGWPHLLYRSHPAPSCLPLPPSL